MNVWLATLRRGIAHHYLRPEEPTKTVCGRFVGRDDDPRGHLLGRQEARDVYASPECAHCAGSYPPKRPVVKRRRG